MDITAEQNMRVNLVLWFLGWLQDFIRAKFPERFDGFITCYCIFLVDSWYLSNADTILRSNIKVRNSEGPSKKLKKEINIVTLELITQ